MNKFPTQIYYTMKTNDTSLILYQILTIMQKVLGENKNMLILNFYIVFKSLSRQFYSAHQIEK